MGSVDAVDNLSADEDSDVKDIESEKGEDENDQQDHDNNDNDVDDADREDDDTDDTTGLLKPLTHLLCDIYVYSQIKFSFRKSKPNDIIHN